MLYIGVDAHQASSMVTVMDETGRVLKRIQVASTPRGLRTVLWRYRQP